MNIDRKTKQHDLSKKPLRNSLLFDTPPTLPLSSVEFKVFSCFSQMKFCEKINYKEVVRELKGHALSWPETIPPRPQTDAFAKTDETEPKRTCWS